MLGRIVGFANLTPQDTVLEIGAGLGNLTRILARTAKRVVAVEIDRNLIPVLREVMNPFQNTEIVQGDILELNPQTLIGEEDYIVVANIPYFITSAIIRHLLTSEVKPSRIVLTMQKEVAERICAKPGNLSLLALSVQVFGTPIIGMTLPASAFFPSPKVDSATLRVDIFKQPFFKGKQLDLFFTLAKIGFSQKRKMLRNTISAGLHWTGAQTEELLLGAGIDPTRRAQTLELTEWRTLILEYEDWLKNHQTK